MKHGTLALSFGLSLLATPALAQYTPPDAGALQGIIVETYYVTDANDAGDQDGGPGLVAGAKVYRIYADLKPGYDLETVYGDATHQLFLNSTADFFNNIDRGEVTGDIIPAGRLDENTVAIDSWISMGAASDAHWGVLETEDTDGITNVLFPNDGGSQSVPGGLLANNDPEAGADLLAADGLLAGTIPTVTSIGVDLSVFGDVPGNSFATNDGAWAVLGGTVGATSENKILIAQITTAGQLCYQLNMRVGIPDSLVCPSVDCDTYIDYLYTVLPDDTAGGGIDNDNILSIPSLVWCSGQELDCLGVPGGTALPGTPCDDGLSYTIDDTWSAACECVGINVGVEENGSGLLFTMTPNPTSGSVLVQATLPMRGDFVLSVRDALGQVVLTQDLGTRNGTWSTMLDMSGMPAGVYFIELRSASQRMMERVIKH